MCVDDVQTVRRNDARQGSQKVWSHVNPADNRDEPGLGPVSTRSFYVKQWDGEPSVSLRLSSYLRDTNKIAVLLVIQNAWLQSQLSF